MATNALQLAELKKCVDGARTLLRELEKAGDTLPKELVRAQDLLECIDHNAERIALALATSRRDKTTDSLGIVASLLREQDAYFQQRCELTGQNLLGKEFYVFPCSHAFHATALRQEMQKHLNSFQRQTVKQLVQKLQELSVELPAATTTFFKQPLAATFPFLNMNLTSSEKDAAATSADNGPSASDAAKQTLAQEREMVQQKLDEIIASECIFCGEVMIKSIHTPFITPEDELAEGAEWKI